MHETWRRRLSLRPSPWSARGRIAAPSIVATTDAQNQISDND